MFNSTMFILKHLNSLGEVDKGRGGHTVTFGRRRTENLNLIETTVCISQPIHVRLEHRFDRMVGWNGWVFGF